MRNRFSPDLTAFSGNLVAADDAPTVAEVMGQLINGGTAPWSWAELAEAAAQFGIPWIAKGVLTPRAAERAVAAGASAVVVSNHGARQIDPTPPSIEMLPAVRRALGPDIPVLLDRGICGGADVYVALALGADAVMIGRAAIYGLNAGAGDGVRRVLELLTEELRALLRLRREPGPLRNNAAVTRAIDLFDVTADDWDAIFRLNTRGYFLAMQAAAHRMRDTGGGSIVNVASIAARGGRRPRTSPMPAPRAR